MVKKKVEKPVEAKVEEPVAEDVIESPSPVERGQLYVESHPILGVTRKVTVTAQSTGDGHVGDGATLVHE